MTWASRIIQQDLVDLRGRPLVISVSGGKDSTVLAHWVQTYWPIKPVLLHADTGWETNTTDAYIRGYLQELLGPIRIVKNLPQLEGEDLVFARHISAQLGKEESAFVWWMVHKKAFSDRRMRWCTSLLKVAPIQRFLWSAYEGQAVNGVGVRAQESAQRAAYSRWDMDESETLPTFVYPVFRPLLTWSEEDIIRYHHDHDIKPNPHYIKGAQRVGCWPCINSRKSEIAMVAHTDPTRIEVIRQLEAYVTRGALRRVASKGEQTHHADGSTKFRTFFMNPTYNTLRREAEARGEDYKQTVSAMSLIDDVVKWAREDGAEEEQAEWTSSCTKWGLCESPLSLGQDVVSVPPAEVAVMSAPPSKRRTAVSTPAALFAGVSDWLGPFDLDACCSGPGTEAPPLCDHWWTPAEDGLAMPWPGFVWCNPPFGDEARWVTKAIHEVRSGDALRVVMLVPVKADLAWWPTAMREACKVGWIRYRLKFGGYGGTAGFPCCLLSFERDLYGPPEHYAVTREGRATLITPLPDARRT